MKTIGIICEYNPFHNGHIYHINKIKEMYPDSTIILCLNGYFLERGDISIISKEDKTKIALDYGVDIVVELPLYYGIQSSDYFADAAIKILDAMGTDVLVFGSETNDIKYLENIVSKQNDIQLDSINNNLNYPAKLQQALNEKKISSNDLLGISYIKSIKKINSNIEPITIKRTNDFLDIDSNDSIISAQNIRGKIKEGINIDNYVPKKIPSMIVNIHEDVLYKMLACKVLTDCHLDEYLDVVEGLENKIRKEIIKHHNINDLILAIKSKRYTYTKIKRMIMHILLGIRKDEDISLSYIHILGFNEKGKQYLNNKKKIIKLPTKVDKTSRMYEIEITGARLYDMITNGNYSTFDLRGVPLEK